MKKLLYIGFTVLWAATFATTAIAKGKPQNSPHSSQNPGQPSGQLDPQQQDPLPKSQPSQDETSSNEGQGKTLKNLPYQPQNTTQQGNSQPSNLSKSMPSRSNKGGLVRGKDRAQQVHNMNNASQKGHHNGNQQLGQ